MQYAKVAEYQLRGVVHFHALVRLDGPRTADGFAPAPHPIDAAAAGRPGRPGRRLGPADRPRRRRPRTRPAVAGVRAPARRPPGPHQPPHRRPGPEPCRPEQVAGYLAKYATKSVDDTGATDTRTTGGSAPPPATWPTGRPITGAQHRRRRLRAAGQMGAHARLPRPLRLQVPPLLGHPRRPAPGPTTRPGPHRPVPAPKAGHSTWPPSRPTCSPTTTTRPPWSSASGTSSVPAGPPKPRPSSPTPPPHEPASTTSGAPSRGTNNELRKTGQGDG